MPSEISWCSFLHRVQAKESRAPMTFGIFDLVCFSQRRLLVEIQLFSCLLVPLSFVEFNCCVAWMSSLLVTVSSDFRVKPKRNKLMVAYQAAIFVCLVVHGKYVRGLSTNLPMNTCS